MLYQWDHAMIIIYFCFTAYLYSFGKTATVQVTEQVTKTAKQIKETIDDKVNMLQLL